MQLVIKLKLHNIRSNCKNVIYHSMSLKYNKFIWNFRFEED